LSFVQINFQSIGFELEIELEIVAF